MQVDPINPTLKPPGSKPLKLKYGIPLSSFAFKFNLRRYSKAAFEQQKQRHGLKAWAFTLVHFSAQPKPFWSHLPVSPCLIEWGKIMHPTYPTKCAYVEPKIGRVLVSPWVKERGRAVGIQTFDLDRLASNTLASHRLVQWVTKHHGCVVSEVRAYIRSLLSST